MKKIFLTFFALFLLQFSFAAQINFLENPQWGDVLKRAKQENKLIFLDAFATWCGPCKSMETDVYTNEQVANFYNTNFINVKYDMEKGEGPMLAEKFTIKVYPSLLFLNSEGNVLHKGVGFHKTDEFIDLGKEASKSESQYFTLKSKALSLSPAQYLKFAAVANASEDEDLADFTRNYLAKQPDILANRDLVNLLMQYTTYLPDEKTLSYIHQNKQKIVEQFGYSNNDVNDVFVKLTMMYAIKAYTDEDRDVFDFDGVKRVLDQYLPEKSFYLFNYFKAQFSAEKGEYNDAITSFNEIVNAPNSKVNFNQLCNLYMNFGETLQKSGQLDMAFAKLDKYTLSPNETSLAFLKDYVKVVIYFKLKDEDKAKLITNKMLESETTPLEIKEELKQVLEQIKKG